MLNIHIFLTKMFNCISCYLDVGLHFYTTTTALCCYKYHFQRSIIVNLDPNLWWRTCLSGPEIERANQPFLYSLSTTISGQRWRASLFNDSSWSITMPMLFRGFLHYYKGFSSAICCLLVPRGPWASNPDSILSHVTLLFRSVLQGEQQALGPILWGAGEPQPDRSSQHIPGVPLPRCQAAVCSTHHQPAGGGMRIH